MSAVRIVQDEKRARERYQSDIARLEREVTRGEQKLANEKFVANAKPGVVAAERKKLDDYRRDLASARSALEALAS